MKLSTKQKLWIAKAWINLSIGMMVLALVGLVGLMGWGIWSLVPPEVLLIFGVVAAGLALIGALIFLFEKAENYVEAHGGSKSE
jgi:hypothetical protein